MSELDDIAQAIVTLIKTEIPELNGYPYIVSSVTAPAFIVWPIDRLSYSDDQDDGATAWMTMRFYVTRKSNGTDQQQLNQYISRDGPKSVYRVLSENPRLGGVVADAMPVEAVNYGSWAVGQPTYLGVELRLRIMLN